MGRSKKSGGHYVFLKCFVFLHLKGANIYDSGPPSIRTMKNAERQLISDKNSNHTANSFSVNCNDYKDISVY